MLRRRLLTTAAWALAFIAFLALNHRLSQTIAANSDGASQALQGWDMLHGNLLQHGWITGDVAYFPNDVSVYGLIGLLHGLNADSVHWYGALMYTLATLLAALLAMGPRAGGGSGGTSGAGAAATSRERWVRCARPPAGRRWCRGRRDGRGGSAHPHRLRLADPGGTDHHAVPADHDLLA
jgi:hypothetical protein